ncbi:arylmalonate decarboxylase [Hydrogenophaga sp.]|uniref:arylmalonate decarboxylase n=1 Tax=Hydrogenophaga sp. TaxID=1904254 RepID=UPI00272F1BE8|nr:arylmalonate decarboxylase [Hydrogenophaga sp.]MDP2015449.1 arylmalonate decarboxylase [Hydrogenophaga sp.]
MSNPTVPCIGLIVPPAAGLVPDDAALLYGDRVRFVARGLGIASISPTGFAPVMHRILDLGRSLRDDGAQAISLMGTSISFYRGAELTEELRASLEHATGLPCTTMSHAVVSSLRALGVQRVAVATSYIDALNERLVDYLTHEGFEVTAVRGLAITGVREVGEVSPEDLMALSESVVRLDTTAQGVFISCGGLQTHGVIEPLESRLGLPVTASSPAGFWDVVRLAGLDPSAQGFGRLFRLTPPPTDGRAQADSALARHR